mmetsp:Transcript_1514/g.3914  ORF Transcript_1514/g.3914 Transcript_1514/m.3914 type:complete len:214 (-) Transcript_1514:1119-1760(-)
MRTFWSSSVRPPPSTEGRQYGGSPQICDRSVNALSDSLLQLSASRVSQCSPASRAGGGIPAASGGVRRGAGWPAGGQIQNGQPLAAQPSHSCHGLFPGAATWHTTLHEPRSTNPVHSRAAFDGGGGQADVRSRRGCSHRGTFGRPIPAGGHLDLAWIPGVKDAVHGAADGESPGPNAQLAGMRRRHRAGRAGTGSAVPRCAPAAGQRSGVAPF